MIGKRLKIARDAAGLSLRDLEQKIGQLVSAQAIGKYERDEMMPSSRVLIALANELDVTPEYLLSKRQLAVTEIDFRRRPGDGIKAERSIEAIVLDYAERYVQLEELMPGVGGVWKAPVAAEFSIRQVEDAEFAAEKLRKTWQLGIGPINILSELLESNGIKILSIGLDEDISGSKAFAKGADNKSAALIVLNANHNGERQRFTMAHELGHLVLNFDPGLSHNQQEKAADRFAGAFLVTKALLERLVGKSRHMIPMAELIGLKRVFKVSVAALVVRCHQLGILVQAGYSRMWAALKARGLVDKGANEPEPIDKEIPTRMKHLCLRGVTEGVLSESKAAEILQISRRELDTELQLLSV